MNPYGIAAHSLATSFSASEIAAWNARNEAARRDYHERTKDGRGEFRQLGVCEDGYPKLMSGGLGFMHCGCEVHQP